MRNDVTTEAGPRGDRDRVPVAGERLAWVAAGVPLAARRAEEAVARAQPSKRAPALLRAAQNASTMQSRVLWMRRAASAWAEPLQAHAACRKGCAHCCHIPVAMTLAEARLIGGLIGHSPAEPQDAPTTDDVLQGSAVLPGTPPEASYEHPCPFLDESACSIYAHRPLACRTQLNLDTDDLLCQLVPGADIPVPYADATQIKAMYVMAQPNARWADIRGFFPRGGAAKSPA